MFWSDAELDEFSTDKITIKILPSEFDTLYYGLIHSRYYVKNSSEKVWRVESAPKITKHILRLKYFNIAEYILDVNQRKP